MTKISMYVAAIAVAIAPACLSLWGDAFFSHTVPVRVPVSAQIGEHRQSRTDQDPAERQNAPVLQTPVERSRAAEDRDARGGRGDAAEVGAGAATRHAETDDSRRGEVATVDDHSGGDGDSNRGPERGSSGTDDGRSGSSSGSSSGSGGGSTSGSSGSGGSGGSGAGSDHGSSSGSGRGSGDHGSND